MKKIYLLFTLVIFMSSCEKEEVLDIEELQENPEITVEKIPFNALPIEVRDLLSQKPPADLQKGQKDKVKFGSPKTNVPAIKNKNKQGQISYTVALKKLKDSLMNSPYFENAVITELEQDRQKITILRYKPKPEWYYSAERDIKKFSGSIEFHTATGKLLGKLSMLNGEGVEEPDDQKGFSTTCTYKSSSICTGESTQDGDVSGGRYGCAYFFTETCTTTYYYSPSDGPDRPSAPEETPDYTGGGGGLNTTPIVVEEVVKVENNLTDPCASNIFESLRTGDLIDRELKPEVQIPSAELFNFTTEILELFNNSKNVDYEISNENLPQPINGTRNGRTTVAPGKVITEIHNGYINTASKLAIARTMIHESIHGYLKLQGYYQSNVSDALIAYANQNGYPNINSAHHSFMTKYINAMSYSLYIWDKNYGSGGLTTVYGSIDHNYYKSLAFAGLDLYTYAANGDRIDSDLFKLLESDRNKRNQIINKIDKENSGQNSRGETCP